tara:strand:+ start:393 stop:533 length:141 start_codon:yes stop_codon:yes gene_type:complete
MKNLLILIIALFILASCSGKGPDIKNPRHKCPDQSERTLKDIFCKE